MISAYDGLELDRLTAIPLCAGAYPLLRGPGRAAALGVVAAALVLRVIDLGIVTESRLRVFDFEERLWPRSSDPARVAIVDIDEKSLAQYGQWPWPRH